jgi:peptidyl-prolyl cis-trans isomerase B (cyclophilin B)
MKIRNGIVKKWGTSNEHICLYHFNFLYFQKNYMSRVKISTDKGEMIAELYDEATPITVKNFLDLINKGFYNGLNFHRVIPNFVVQGGCPEGTGRGGPGYNIPCEVTAPNQYHDKGVLSMAHAGRNTGGSQFFICHNRQGTQHLDGNHTCFGKVVEGLDVIDQISQGDKINSMELI